MLFSSCKQQSRPFSRQNPFDYKTKSSIFLFRALEAAGTQQFQTLWSGNVHIYKTESLCSVRETTTLQQVDKKGIDKRPRYVHNWKGNNKKSRLACNGSWENCR